MTAEHSISDAAALMIALGLSNEAFDQLLTIAGADGPDIHLKFDQVRPELARLVDDQDGIARLNFVGTAVLATVFEAFKAGVAETERKALS